MQEKNSENAPSDTLAPLHRIYFPKIFFICLILTVLDVLLKHFNIIIIRAYILWVRTCVYFLLVVIHRNDCCHSSFVTAISDASWCVKIVYLMSMQGRSGCELVVSLPGCGSYFPYILTKNCFCRSLAFLQSVCVAYTRCTWSDALKQLSEETQTSADPQFKSLNSLIWI
jgi:hypothetical protein